MPEGINWEAVLIPAIPGLLALIGVIYGIVYTRRNNRDNNDATKQARREPTWNEVVNENRSLRKDLDAQKDNHTKQIEDLKADHDAKFKELEKRFETFVNKTNTRIGALSNMLHTASVAWPADQPGPYFDREDLDALENTDVPYVWRNRIRPGYGAT